MERRCARFVEQKFLEIGNIVHFAKRNIKNNKFMNFENNSQSSNEISQEEFFNSVREVVAKKVSEILGKNEEEIIEQEKEFYYKYVSFLTISTVASMASGNYFESMIPSATHKPTREYNQESLFPLILKAEEFKWRKQMEGKDDSFTNINKEFNSEVYEEERDGIKKQVAYNRIIRENKSTVLEEIVSNYLTEKMNDCHSILLITDLKMGLKIDLGQMLPRDCSFAPSEMVKFEEEEYDPEKRETKYKFHPVDLNDYKGPRGSSTDFNFTTGLNKVVYGDLSEAGNIIILFHEIAHSWQSVYYEGQKKKTFNDFHNEVLIDLKILKDMKDDVKKGEMTQKKYEKIAEHISQKFKKLGVEFNLDNFVYDKGQKLENDSLIITDFKGDQYVVKCSQFDAIKKNFESEERDAWAHALLMLRFLRKRGIDLEPDLSSSEIRSKINNHLKTYKDYIENKIKVVK